MDVILLHAGTDERGALELLREVTGLGRVEALGLLANLPRPALQGLGEGEARALRRRFEEVGATVALR